MRRTIVVASMALLLTTAACGSKDGQTTSIPGVGSVSTTQEGDTTKVQVTGPQGQTASVDTTKEGDGTKVQVTGPGGQTASVQTNQEGGGTQVNIQGPGGQTINIDTSETGDQEGTSEGTVSVTDEKGQTATYSGSDKIDEAALGVPLYPGAQVVNGGTSETSGVDGKKLKVANAELTTKDPVEKVAAFYAGKVKAANKVDTTEDGRRTVIFAPTNPMQGTTIVVTQEEDGNTHVTIATQG